MRSVSERYGISAPTIYKWLRQPEPKAEFTKEESDRKVARQVQTIECLEETLSFKEKGRGLVCSTHGERRQLAFRLIEMNQANLPIQKMCDVLKVSKGSFYRWRKHVPSQREEMEKVLKQVIRRLRVSSPLHRYFGAPRMHALVVQEGYQVGKNRVARLMREMNIRGSSKRRRVGTMDFEQQFEQTGETPECPIKHIAGAGLTPPQRCTN